MNGASTRPVAIIGAGFAGLVAARELARRSIPFVVFEATSQVGGLARSFKDEEGFGHDLGAHFITNRLAREIGVEDQCMDVRRYGETVVLGGNRYSYPFGLLRTPRYVRGAVTARLSGSNGALSAAEYFESQFGAPMANEVILPLIEAWSGAPSAELAASVGEKISAGVAETIWLKAAAAVTRRAVANGYCREMPQSARVWHVYPERGVGVLSRALADELGGSIRLETPAEAIFVEDETVSGIRAGGEEMDVSAVLSTAPVHVLPNLVQGTDSLDHLRNFRYRPMAFVNLRLEGRGLLPNVVVWTPDEHLPFFRLTEAIQSMPWLAPEGKTIITLDFGCEVGDELWEMTDDELGELSLAGLEESIPDVRERVLGWQVLKTPIAYPKFLLSYERERQAWEAGTGIDGLVSIGRNGEFAHILMEDVYWRTIRKVRRLAEEQGWEYAPGP